MIDSIILARGGSKGVPGKNIIDFCGKPLLAWTIEQCIQVESIGSVWVSSDNDNILNLAKLYGAKTIKRPENISSDTSTSESGWLHAINTIEREGVVLDAILAPQVTSPLREKKDIDRAIDKFINNKLDSLFSASMADDLYYWEKNDKGILDSINYDYHNRKRRQDFQQQIIENGSFYIFKQEIIKKYNNRLGGRIGYSKMDFWKMFEIDNMKDLRMCSALMKEFLIKD
jgi:CMP-N,N'-diacetyllegionaminic acid synthase